MVLKEDFASLTLTTFILVFCFSLSSSGWFRLFLLWCLQKAKLTQFQITVFNIQNYYTQYKIIFIFKNVILFIVLCSCNINVYLHTTYLKNKISYSVNFKSSKYKTPHHITWNSHLQNLFYHNKVTAWVKPTHIYRIWLEVKEKSEINLYKVPFKVWTG